MELDVVVSIIQNFLFWTRIESEQISCMIWCFSVNYRENSLNHGSIDHDIVGKFSLRL